MGCSYKKQKRNYLEEKEEKGRKSNIIWVDQRSEFYKNSFKDFLKINNIEMCLTYNEGKSVVAEIFIRTRKSKIFKHMKIYKLFQKIFILMS